MTVLGPQLIEVGLVIALAGVVMFFARNAWAELIHRNLKGRGILSRSRERLVLIAKAGSISFFTLGASATVFGMFLGA